MVDLRSLIILLVASTPASAWSPASPPCRIYRWSALGAVLPELEVEATSLDVKLEPPPPPTPDPLPPRRALSVSSEIDLPFPSEIAFDAFADLHRQPEWSPWLHSVDYIDIGEGNPSGKPATKWTLKVMGVSYSWISVATNSDRPYLIEWESVSGLKNFGQVQFKPLPDNRGSHMTMTMTFVPPRLVAAVFRNPSGVKNFMERNLLGSSLRLFRDIIVESTLDGLLEANATMLFLPI